MEKNITFIIILVVLTVLSFALYSYLTDKDIYYYLDMVRFDEPKSENNNGDQLDNYGGGILKTSRGTSGEEEGEKSGGDDETKEPLLDFESSPCGFYFAEYGVCSGTCPGGTCVSEGRSCYCKK